MKRCWHSSPIWLFAFLFSCNSPQKADRPIDFEKIVFHTTMCFGKCPTYHLSVDKEKNLMLYAEEVYRNPRDFNTYEIDYSKVGYFRGKVDDSTFNSLQLFKGKRKMRQIFKSHFVAHLNGLVLSFSKLVMCQFQPLLRKPPLRCGVKRFRKITLPFYPTYQNLGFPSDNMIKGWNQGLDGTTYIVEHADKYVYWYKNYWTPSAQGNLREALIVEAFVNGFSDTWALHKAYNRFMETLPRNGCYNNGGMGIICYAGNSLELN